jgi:glycosyltransferase involved in cell wall biosynthesis
MFNIEVKVIVESGLFDVDWYLNEYPDVRASGVEPVLHFVKYGWRMGRNPSPRFSVSKYLEFHYDVYTNKVNPLLHYIRYGSEEGRRAVGLNESHASKNTLKSSNVLGFDDEESVLNEYFDHVYVVNLDRSMKEKVTVSKHLKQHGVDFQLWKATDGFLGAALETYNEYTVRSLGSLQRYSEYNEREISRGKSFIESAGAVGYIYTYLSILKDAKENNFDKFLILEDDVILSNNFNTDFKRFISNIPENWKVLQLGASQYGWNSFSEVDAEQEGHYYPRRLDTCGSFSIAIRGSIIDELIEAESAFEAPFDHLPLGELYERYLGSCYVAYPNIVMPDVRDSKIRGGRDQFSHAEKMKWLPENFDFPQRVPVVSILVNSPKNLNYAEKFSATKDGPINIIFYGLSASDGLRPVHNYDNLCWLREITNTDSLQIPSSDYCLTVSADSVVIEEDVIDYVLDKLAVGDEYSGPLRQVELNESLEVSGRVSVIIPTYKRPTNLLNALTSVAEQDYLYKEILVVNDTGNNSEYNEEIANVVRGVIAKFPNVNIKFIEHWENRNGAAARNTGFLASTGEYICYLDDDDIYLPGRLTKTVDSLSIQGNHIGAVYCGFLGWNSPVNDINRYAEGNLTKEILLLDYFKHYVHTNTVTYRRSAVTALNGFDESYNRHQDLEFNLRFFELFDIVAVKNAMVRLNPAPSDISNKVFNLDMLNLKKKFLGQFKNTISSLGSEAEKIYKTHWLEVDRYISDPQQIRNYLESDYTNGSAQIALTIKQSE